MFIPYLPLFYLENVKRPGKNYFLTCIIYTDLAVLLLSLIWLQPYPSLQGMGIFFLLLSFWCVYEIGYYENDLIAEQYEVHPTLSKTYENYRNYFSSRRAWIWSVLLSVLGLSMLGARWSGTASWIAKPELLIDIAKWSAFLGIVRLTFFIYNHLDQKTRIWLYPLLQIYKYFGYLIFLPVSSVGVSLFVAQVLSSSTAYIIYRYSQGWPDELPTNFIRLSLFLFLLFASSLSLQDYSSMLTWQAVLVLIYCSFRARHEIVALFSSAYVISCDKENN